MRKVIFDTDPGIDDAMALLFAHLSADIELVGVTSVFGNASLEQTTRNAHYLVSEFGLDCPVHAGAAEPLQIAIDEAPVFVHGFDGMGDAGTDAPPVAEQGDAVSFLIDMVRAHPGQIDVVAVGRMTNLALALQRDPDFAGFVRSVVIMGGALGRHGFSGNVTPVAEANIIGDPHAADLVFCAPWALTMVGLDVTMRTLMAPQMMKRLRADAGRVGQFVYDISRHYQSFYEARTGSPSFPVHDSLALINLIRPDLFEASEGGLRVCTEGMAIGQTILVPQTREYPEAPWTADLPTQQASVDVDSEAALALYMQTLLDGAGG
ncbi:MAG: nucleoside hydrolase [Pseudomonadota bacterium]